MSDSFFAKRITAHLDVAAEQLDDRVAARLRAAREQALAQHRVARPSMSAGSGFMRPFRGWRWRPALGVAAVLMVTVTLFSTTDFRTETELAGVPQDVDAALLMDELPIEAYLDADFRAWLLRDS